MNDMPREDLLALVTNRETLTRREFVAGTLATGFALAVQPVCAPTMIVTDTAGLTAGEVQIPVGGSHIPAYVAMPAQGQAFPTILVVQEIFGVHEHIKDVCRRLAKIGYLAVAPSLYHRQGDVSQLKDNKEILSQVVSKVPDWQVMRDIDATVRFAELNGGSRYKLGVTGFCWGGRITWMYTAHNNYVKAGVAWYGRLTGEKNAMTPQHPIDIVDNIRAPVLGLYGGDDAGIPVKSVEEMNAALRKRLMSEPSLIHVYPDTPHAFHADYRPSYRERESRDAWDRCIAWFKKNGVAA